MVNRRPLEILLVEDNPGDVRLTEEALRSWRVPPHLRIAADGEEALQILRNPVETRSERPDLILLDLNLPKLSGREFLREVKGSDALRDIPVIVLSSSASDDDVAAAYGLHANCYIVKPVYLDEYLDVLRAIEEFWVARVLLSPVPRIRPARVGD